LRLDQLVDTVEVLDVRGDLATADITDVTHDSRAVRPGALFCCIRGDRVDGHDLAAVAVAAGGAALLCERFVEAAVPQVRVAAVRPVMGTVAAACHGHPSQVLDVVGVTGTNGKTTTTLMLRAVLEADGRPTGFIGTLTGARTTPEATDLQRQLRALVDDGRKAAAIEVSSVGLAQHRLVGTRFAAGVFTNLSPDELRFHGTMEDYFAAKASLFERERCEVGIVNGDDEWGRRLLASAGIRTVPFSIADAEGRQGSHFRWRGAQVDLPLEGEFNVMNALAAATAAAELGVSPAVAADALSRFEPAPGYGTEVDAGQSFRVLVDFAHTGGALRSVLQAVRPEDGGRVIVVFGCGGDRDPTRRQLMGEAASAEADVIVVTSDNPRTEDPMAIIDAVVAGVGEHAALHVEPDRRAAIALAVGEAREGDVVVIAGKGHETGQIVGDQVLPFDDHEVALELLRGRAAQ
jgi:UDP-N-acetylmuramoyl-L-alanyl-D-glutamate--2,6-diaminopimelate ligase